MPVCLCVCFCSASDFGIAQHRLGNAVETASVFCKTVITSCPASAAGPASPALQRSSRGLCVGARLQTRVASRHMGRNESCVAFLVLVQGSPPSLGIVENPTAHNSSDKTQTL